MSARCPVCQWEGSAAKVVNGGQCPECRDVPVIYDAAPLADVSIKTAEAFNKRAIAALDRLPLSDFDATFLDSIRSLVSNYQPIGDGRQKLLLRVVERMSSRIHDKAVADYAVVHAPKVTS